MSRPQGRRIAVAAPGRASAHGVSWLRVVAIAIGAVILASCRSLPVPPAGAALLATLAVDDDGTAQPPGDAAVATAGLEAPSPPLPRTAVPCAACETCDTAPAASFRTGRFIGAAPCGPGPCGPQGCQAGVCPPPACVPCVGFVPVAAPCLVCNGGDSGAPARPATGATALQNLGPGDTVARYRPADDADDADEVRLAVANCACVYAPRFASVREVVRPFEDAAPQGPRGLARDASAGVERDLVPVRHGTQTVAVEAARKALPGVAVEERLGPLAVDQGDVPLEDEGHVRPAAHVADDAPELTRLRQRPLASVGFDVPLAWTCVKGANVLVDGRSAEVVAADRGTATLRFEEPGRAELTLCKRADSDTARPGEELGFTIFLLNSGDRPLADVVLADAVPARLKLVPGSPASSLPAVVTTSRGDDGATVVEWRMTGTLAPGESGFVRFRTVVQ